jgi:hypothetical protein
MRSAPCAMVLSNPTSQLLASVTLLLACVKNYLYPPPKDRTNKGYANFNINLLNFLQEEVFEKYATFVDVSFPKT